MYPNFSGYGDLIQVIEQMTSFKMSSRGLHYVFWQVVQRAISLADTEISLYIWCLKLDNQVFNSTCPKDKLGWIWWAEDP